MKSSFFFKNLLGTIIMVISNNICNFTLVGLFSRGCQGLRLQRWCSMDPEKVDIDHVIVIINMIWIFLL